MTAAAERLDPFRLVGWLFVIGLSATAIWLTESLPSACLTNNLIYQAF